jgi:hypothetical protein
MIDVREVIRRWQGGQNTRQIAGFAHRDHPFRAIVTGRSGPS